MKSSIKKALSVAAALICFLTVSSLEVLANSAQRHWAGVDSTGATLSGGECPLEVTKEILTFDIDEFPSNHYFSEEEFLAYTGKVTAEYTFYNPTDAQVSATLVFPFGKQPDYSASYVSAENPHASVADTQKYGITVNGAEIEKRVRYTLASDTEFDLSEDLSRLRDGYATDSFYYPEMTVTKYTYMVGGVNKDGLIDQTKYSGAAAAFDWDGGDGNVRLYLPSYNGFRITDDGARICKWVKNGDTISVLAFGNPLSSPLQWKCYKDGGTKDRDAIDGKIELISTETSTFYEFALENRRDDMGISEVDFYNAVVDCLSNSAGKTEFNLIYDVGGLYTSPDRFLRNLMRWYEYEITVEPGSTVTNAVTAPIYPRIDASYNPPIYTYTYLLSPASTWADFGELQIIVNTPYYITQSEGFEFTKTDGGYSLKTDGLPDRELVMTLCSVENPEAPKGSFLGILGGTFIAASMTVVSFIALGVGAVFLLAMIICLLLKIDKATGK